MFYRDKPVDWLLSHVFWVKYCSPEKTAKECNKVPFIFAFSPEADKGEKIRTTRVRMCAPYGQTPFPVGIFSDAFSRMTIAYVVRLVEASKLKKEFVKSLQYCGCGDVSHLAPRSSADWSLVA